MFFYIFVHIKPKRILKNRIVIMVVRGGIGNTLGSRIEFLDLQAPNDAPIWLGICADDILILLMGFTGGFMRTPSRNLFTGFYPIL